MRSTWISSSSEVSLKLQLIGTAQKYKQFELLTLGAVKKYQLTHPTSNIAAKEKKLLRKIVQTFGKKRLYPVVHVLDSRE